MSIDALSSYLNSLSSILATGNQTSTSSSSSSTSQSSTDFDSYISTIGSEDTPLPSETYSDIVVKIASASKSSEDSSATEYSSVSTDSSESATSVSGGSSSGSSEDDGTTTETEIVMINGKLYLQTTVTDADGNVTVTQEPLEGGVPMDEMPPMPPMDEEGNELPPLPPMDEEDSTNGATVTATEA